jgi:hypothetical protein
MRRTFAVVIVNVFLQAESFMPSPDNGVRVAQPTLSLP